MIWASGYSFKVGCISKRELITLSFSSMGGTASLVYVLGFIYTGCLLPSMELSLSVFSFNDGIGGLRDGF